MRLSTLALQIRYARLMRAMDRRGRKRRPHVECTRHVACRINHGLDLGQMRVGAVLDKRPRVEILPGSDPIVDEKWRGWLRNARKV